MKYVIKLAVWNVLCPENQMAITLCKSKEGEYYWEFDIIEDTIISDDREELKLELKAAYMQMLNGGLQYPAKYFDDGNTANDRIEIAPLKETEDGTYTIDRYTDLIEYYTYLYNPTFKYLVCTTDNPDICLSNDYYRNQHGVRRGFYGSLDPEEVPYLSSDKKKWIRFDDVMGAMIEINIFENENKGTELVTREEVVL